MESAPFLVQEFINERTNAVGSAVVIGDLSGESRHMVVAISDQTFSPEEQWRIVAQLAEKHEAQESDTPATTGHLDRTLRDLKFTPVR